MVTAKIDVKADTGVGGKPDVEAAAKAELPPLPVDVDLGQLQWLLGDVTKARITQLTHQGVVIRTARNRYALRSVPNYFTWLRQANAGPDGWNRARTALVEERALAAQAARLEREGQVAQISDFVEIMQALFRLVRDRALALPAKLSPLAYQCDSIPATYKLLDLEVREWLTNLSETKVIDDLKRRSERGNGKRTRKAG